MNLINAYSVCYMYIVYDAEQIKIQCIVMILIIQT